MKTATLTRGFPGDSVVKNLPVNAGDVGSVPGSEKSPGEGNGNPLQFSHHKRVRYGHDLAIKQQQQQH